MPDVTPPNGQVTPVATVEPAVRRAAAGSLTITPDQTALTPEQKAAFSSLGVDPNDPVARAHVRRFVHVCQLWGLDPWSQGEIYLVQRGQAPKRPNDDDKRTWTIQTGIEGYRKRARTTGRWVGTAKWYWSDDDDSEKAWRESIDKVSGDIVMRRVWWEAWPTKRGNPAMAKAVIQVYGEDGELRTEEYVAHWERYAAYEDVWEGQYPNRRKKLNPDGSTAQKPGKFWGPGSGPEQLAKCAEAAVLRQAFSNLYHGVYTSEEMGRAEADAKAAVEEAVAEQRREAFRAAQAKPPKPAVLPGTVETQSPAESATGPAVGEPVRAADIPVEQVLPPRLGEATRHRMILEEIDWIGELLGSDSVRASLARRAGADNLEAMTADDILAWVGPFRGAVVIPRLREAGRHAEADSYASFGADVIAPPLVLCGLEQPPGPQDPPGQADEQANVHPFVAGQDDSHCAQCDGYEDDPQHEGVSAQQAA